MPAKHVSVKGTSGRTYDMNALAAESRADSTKKLTIQLHEYKDGEKPNPSDLMIGQIWISRKIV
jgi:hypothetical protein